VFKNRLPVLLYTTFRTLVVMLMLTGCFGQLPKEMRTTLGSGNYDINGLVNGIPNALSPLGFTLSSRGVEPRYTGPAATWTQQEFETIRVSFTEKVLRDTPERWKIAHLFFRLNCQHVGVGLQMANFEMFRNEGDWPNSARVERHMSIFAQDREVTYYDDQAVPDLQPWTAIDIKKVRLSADEALNVAERSGGSGKRPAVGEPCGIRIEMNGWEGNHWRVTYSYLLSPTRSEDFVVIVDAETGQVK